MQKWIIKKFHFIGCNLYLLPDMRKSQLLYIGAVTIPLLRSGIQATGNHSRGEYAPQSTGPATVGCKPAQPFLIIPCNYISHAIHTKSMMRFYSPCRGETLVVVRKKQVGNCSSDRDLK